MLAILMKRHVFIQPEADKIKNVIKKCWKQASDAALNDISVLEQQQLMKVLAKIENNILKDLE